MHAAWAVHATACIWRSEHTTVMLFSFWPMWALESPRSCILLTSHILLTSEDAVPKIPRMLPKLCSRSCFLHCLSCSALCHCGEWQLDDRLTPLWAEAATKPGLLYERCARCARVLEVIRTEMQLSMDTGPAGRCSLTLSRSSQCFWCRNPVWSQLPSSCGQSRCNHL